MLERLIELRKQSLKDPNAFLESLFAISQHRQAALHREGQAWLDEHSKAMICWPRDHGKTTQIAGRASWEIGRNPQIRIKYCCEADDVAYHRSRFIRRIVENGAWFRFCFPHVLPDEPWGDVSWTVKRPAPLVDPTFHALGVGTASTGGRADLLIADDLVGVKSLRSKQERERAKSYWRNNLVNLCEPDARIWVIYTPWSDNDINADLEKRFPLLKRPVGPNLEPVWPEKWPTERLRERENDIGKLAFSRGYRLRTVSEGETILGPWLHLARAPEKPTRTIFGVDVAVKKAESNDRSAIAVLVHDGVRWTILKCWARRTSTPELLTVLASMCEMYRPQVIAWEDTAMQSGIWDLARRDPAFSKWASLLRPVKHSASKISRLEAAAPHFSSGLLSFASDDGIIVNNDLQELWNEVTLAPLAEHDDTWDAVLTGFEFAMMHKPGEVR